MEKILALRAPRRAQSIIEVLIAVAIAAILFAGGAALIRPAIVANTQVGQVQEKAALANELLSNVTAWASGSWNAFSALATTSANLYYLNTSSSPFIAVAASSGESVVVGSTTYTRFFYIDNIYRDASGNATTTATTTTSYDPSTVQVTIVVNTPGTGASTTDVIYLTRNGSAVTNQASWAGGSGQAGPITVSGNQYYAATNVTTTSSGTLQLTPQ